MRSWQLREKLFDPDTVPAWGLVLGSGFGGWLHKLSEMRTLPFSDVEGIVRPTVLGHEGYFGSGLLEGVPVAVCSGRLHLYEGLSVKQVTAPVRELVRMGVSSVILTTAVGAVSDIFSTGESVVIADQINLTGTDPYAGTGRFPDTSALFDPTYTEFLTKKGMRKGILAGVRGPSYETPAEVRALKSIGADIVSMSTVPESLALAESGIRCAAVALVANRAGSPGTAHEKVVKEIETEADRIWEAVRDLILSPL